MKINIPLIKDFVENIENNKYSVRERYTFLKNVITQETDEINYNDSEETLEFQDYELSIKKRIDQNAHFLGANIDELLYSDIKWSSNLIDYLISAYTNENGVFSTVNALGWGEDSVEFSHDQLKVINWKSSNILKYFAFISIDFCYNDCVDDVKREFIEGLYINKNRWTYDELIEFQKFNDWYQLSKVGDFDRDERIFETFKNDIRYDLLIFNKRFNFDKDLLFKILSNETISKRYKPSFNDLINSNFPIDVDVFRFYTDPTLTFRNNDKDLFKIVSKANLTEELIIHLSSFLNLEYESKSSYRKKSGGDVDYYDYGYRLTYWHWLCKNSNIVWNDNLIEKYFDNLVFEELSDVRISCETIEKLFYYKRHFTEFHFDFGLENSFFQKDIQTSFNSILLKCDITNLNLNYFLKNEVKFFKLWFNESIVNKYIFRKILI